MEHSHQDGSERSSRRTGSGLQQSQELEGEQASFLTNSQQEGTHRRGAIAVDQLEQMMLAQSVKKKEANSEPTRNPGSVCSHNQNTFTKKKQYDVHRRFNETSSACLKDLLHSNSKEDDALFENPDFLFAQTNQDNVIGNEAQRSTTSRGRDMTKPNSKIIRPAEHQEQNEQQKPRVKDGRKRQTGTKKPHKGARFYWKPRGNIDVQPNITGPNQKIEVRWRIPVSEVSLSSYNKRACDSVDSLDWIGLFRSRKQIDDVENNILTREIRGNANLIYDDKDNQKYAIGRIQLRTPRGVGSYDFRYFKYSNRDGDFDQEDDDSDHVTRLPVTRSAPIIVEVQGAALYEAINFVRENLNDVKRISNSVMQFVTLLEQLKTLRKPLTSDFQSTKSGGFDNKDYRDKRRNKYNTTRKAVYSQNEIQRMGDAQEMALAKLAISTIFSCLRKIELRCDDLDRKIEEATPKASEKREIFNKLEMKRREVVANDEELNDGDFEIWKEAKSESLSFEKYLNQTKRELLSISTAMRALIDEVLACKAITKFFAEAELMFLYRKLQFFCPLSGKFFKNLESMKIFYEKEMNIEFNEQAKVKFKVTNLAFELVPNVRVDLQSDISTNYRQVLELEVAQLAQNLSPPEGFLQPRLKFLQELEDTINQKVSWNCKAKLVPFGSSANNFGSVKSDLDICLVLLPFEANWPEALAQDILVFDSITPLRAVEDLARVFEEEGMHDVDDQRKTARIPIIKFINLEGLECDICINNRLAIRNTMLLHTYSKIDPRVCQIAYIVKKWAKQRNINNPAKHTLPSYGYLLLIIRYLQVAGLLPVLQKLSPDWDGNAMSDIPDTVDEYLENSVLISGPDGKKRDTYFYGDPVLQMSYQDQLAKLQAYASRNKISSAELLVGFFEFYGFQLDYRRYVVSIRYKDWISKEQKAAEDSWKLHFRLSIEDPFETGYDVAHVLNESAFDSIRRNFARAYAILIGRSLEGDCSSPSKALNLLLQEDTSEETEKG